MNNILYILVPCYNEQEILKNTASILRDKLTSMISSGLISEFSRIVLIDDGSSDATWSIIKALCRDEYFRGIHLMCNAGHQNALMAGFNDVTGECDACITIDADLQDDISVMDYMVKKWLAGADIVCGVRSSRSSDSFLKRFTAEKFYSVMQFCGAKSIYNHADYRLMNKKAMQVMCQYEESSLYLRGIIAQMGLKIACVHYCRSKRIGGETKYTPEKMIKLAVSGLVGFTSKPLHMLAMAAGGLASVQVLILFGAVINMIFGSGVSWNLLSNLYNQICNIVILVGLAVIGEYVGEILIEAKHRPRFIYDYNETISANNQPKKSYHNFDECFRDSEDFRSWASNRTRDCASDGWKSAESCSEVGGPCGCGSGSAGCSQGCPDDMISAEKVADMFKDSTKIDRVVSKEMTESSESSEGSQGHSISEYESEGDTDEERAWYSCK